MPWFLTGTADRIKRRSYDDGQAATEYVLLIFVIVLFLIVITFLMSAPLIGAVNNITSWTASIGLPGSTHRGGGEDNSNNQGKHNGDNNGNGKGVSR